MFHFYSRPCGRGDHQLSGTLHVIHLFLLTPLREGRHFAKSLNVNWILISTHAPAGGATYAPDIVLSINELFLLTPLREGRRARDTEVYIKLRISTHAPAGGATGANMSMLSVYHPISTHAPAGGATENSSRSKRALYDFDTRPCGRGDNLKTVNAISAHIFLLTPLREGRP